MKNGLNNISTLPDYNIKLGAREQEDVVKEYTPFIRFIARKFLSKIPNHIELDDLISCGVMGLIDAIKKYDPERKNKFKTYAEFRIRGAILDELRNLDFVPRSIRDKFKLIEKIKKELEKNLGRIPSEREMADTLAINLEEYQMILDSIKTVHMVNIDDIIYNYIEEHNPCEQTYLSDERISGNPFFIVNYKHSSKIIFNSITALPELEQSILKMYYYEGLKIREISDKLNITSARVSQLHVKAINLLKDLLKNIFENADDLSILQAA
ncbi:MAG: FliA/WhiG family RNA polymerase sigma factor [Oligoflexia bacterium]|nr:FliA/WhiG family RNA polymerase sigma factor [Oligoflexia bacterium]